MFNFTIDLLFSLKEYFGYWYNCDEIIKIDVDKHEEVIENFVSMKVDRYITGYDINIIISSILYNMIDNNTGLSIEEKNIEEFIRRKYEELKNVYLYVRLEED